MATLSSRALRGAFLPQRAVRCFSPTGSAPAFAPPSGFSDFVDHEFGAKLASRPVALVTGGTRGVGTGVSAALAARGFDLILGYCANAEAASRLAASLREQYGVRVATHGGDLASFETVESYLEVLGREFEGQQLQAVVHKEPRALSQLSKTEIANVLLDEQFKTGTFGRLVERVAPLLPVGEGSIVGISSNDERSLQAVAKRYATALASRGLTINIVRSGSKADAWMALSRSAGMGMVQDHALLRSPGLSPLGYTDTARELGRTVSFLCSPAARHLTGSVYGTRSKLASPLPQTAFDLHL